MASNPEGEPFDFDRHADELDINADILDLDAARANRTRPTPGPDDIRPDDPADDGDNYDDPTAVPVLVDSADAQRVPRFTWSGLREGERRPLLPAWATSRSQALSGARWLAGLALHVSGYHALRVPKYAVKVAFRSPRGLGRVLRAVVHWTWDLEGKLARQATADRADAELYLKLSKQRDRRVRWRGLVAGTGVLVVAPIVALAALGLPGWQQGLTLAALIGLLGIAGKPADKPLLDTAVVRSAVPVLTSDAVVTALAALGIAGINQALGKSGSRGISFPAPIARDGDGWRAEVDLPAGVTAGQVMEKRANLAAGLSRPLGCVWPEGRPEVHPGRLVLWVGDKDMASARQPAWPLLKSGKVDLFEPFPFGTDQRGRVIKLTMMFASMVIGSVPRMGKTFAARLVLLAAALDVRAEIYAYDLKGTGDFDVLMPVAHRHRAGDEDEEIAACLADLREVHTEMRRRTKAIRALPRDLCPENKITPEIASKKALRLHPIVIGVDECQIWFEHPTYGSDLESICEDLVRRGPAVGIIPLFATQRPDAKSLPPAISGNAVLRFCLKVMGHTENDMVLGTSAHKNGIRATLFSRSDKGIGFLKGEGDDPAITRTYFIDGPAADIVVARARSMREKAGRLSGHALGQQPDAAPTASSFDLLADILSVIPAGEAKVWNETVVDRLAELRPDAYGPWADLEPDRKTAQLTAAVKPYGIRVADVGKRVEGKAVTRRGISRDDLTAAITDRDRKRKAS
ncbi:cell division protein FtsK [Longispora sp. NPDC051575]|uniref:cell division protein FtsK n=1 Tax=Longispora sp. NPDC051575 TaxID=3154943 RepID=UPI00344A10F6